MRIDAAPNADSLTQEHQQRVTTAVEDFVRNRATIEQAKGILILVYGIDAEDAFDVLRRHSQAHNVKLRLVAEQVVELGRANRPAPQRVLDGLLNTVQQSVSATPRPGPRSQ